MRGWILHFFEADFAGPTPVSYTHLDVYKRQHMGLQLPGGHVMPQTGVAGFHGGGHVAEAIVL